MITRRKIVGGVLLIVIGLPVASVLVVAVFFNALNPVFLNVSNQINGTIVSSDQKREYLLYVPESYDRAKPAQLN